MLGQEVEVVSALSVPNQVRANILIGHEIDHMSKREKIKEISRCRQHDDHDDGENEEDERFVLDYKGFLVGMWRDLQARSGERV